MKILFEASGSLTGGYLIKAASEAGFTTVASDIVSECYATELADEFVVMPKTSAPDLWERIDGLLEQHAIDLVIPSLDETLLGWAERAPRYRSQGVQVVISEAPTVEIFQDKWRTYQFFERHNIPTPATSLTKEYDIVKPIHGRGSVGVDLHPPDDVDMTGMVSQERLTGTEYTVDVLCDHTHQPVYIVPRRRLTVVAGKSVNGVTERHDGIIQWVKTICANVPFTGPINIQCFEQPDGSIKFLEINPRVAGGMALGFAATENWFRLIRENILKCEAIEPCPTRWGLQMRRYYAEVFVS